MAHTSRPQAEYIDTLVIGGGQAGLSTSYWLKHAGIEHLVLEGRRELGGSWHDRWDGFSLVAPNYTLQLPGMPYSGPEPDAFMPRAGVLSYVQDYARAVNAPLLLGAGVSLLQRANGLFEAHSERGVFLASKVVLATGPYQRPKLPAFAEQLSPHIHQLHSNEYRNPNRLPEGGVLVVGSGQSGAQIAEELLDAGRDVHLAVSKCPAAPRRYRGRDVIWWLYQSFLHGDEVGVHFPTVEDLPSPAERFACNPHLSGARGGHDLHLREFARRGMHLYGRLEALDGTRARFSDDLRTRLAYADKQFYEEFAPLFDAYIAASGADATAPEPPPQDDFTPATQSELDLWRAGVKTVLWATGYRLDFGWVKVPIFDEWGYPRHVWGRTEQPGLFAVGLPWLHSEPSSVFAGIGIDTKHVVAELSR